MRGKKKESWLDSLYLRSIFTSSVHRIVICVTNLTVSGDTRSRRRRVKQRRQVKEDVYARFCITLCCVHASGASDTNAQKEREKSAIPMRAKDEMRRESIVPSLGKRKRRSQVKLTVVWRQERWRMFYLPSSSSSSSSSSFLLFCLNYFFTSEANIKDKLRLHFYLNQVKSETFNRKRTNVWPVAIESWFWWWWGSHAFVASTFASSISALFSFCKSNWFRYDEYRVRRRRAAGGREREREREENRITRGGVKWDDRKEGEEERINKWMTSQVSDHWPSRGDFFSLSSSVSAKRMIRILTKVQLWHTISRHCTVSIGLSLSLCSLFFFFSCFSCFSCFPLSRPHKCSRKQTIARNLRQWITDLTYCFCKDNHRPHWCQRKPNKWTFRSLTQLHRKMLFTGLCTFTCTCTVKREAKQCQRQNKKQITNSTALVTRCS